MSLPTHTENGITYQAVYEKNDNAGLLCGICVFEHKGDCSQRPCTASERDDPNNRNVAFMWPVHAAKYVLTK